MTMKVITPIVITDANSISNIPDPDTSVDSNDPADWAIGSYVVGDRATYETTTGIHDIYECVVAISGNKPPPLWPVEWVYVSRVNAHKMYDLSNTSQTSYPLTIDVTITPNTITNTIALFNIQAQTVQVTVDDPVAGVVYDETIDVQSPPSQSNWYNYFFDDITYKRDLIVSIPSYRAADIRVQINHSSIAKCGSLILGKAIVLSDGIHHGASVGIQDYSRKEKDQFGEYNFVRRAYAKRANFTMWIPNGSVDATQQVLADLSGTPTLYIGADEFTSTAILGFYKDFDITIAYADTSVCTLQLEGLT